MSAPQPSASVARGHLHRNLVWKAMHVLTSMLTHSWLRVRVSGLEHIDNTRGGILLFNHQSYLDPLLVAVRLSRPVSYLARDSLFRVPGLGWILRRTYVTAVNRAAFRGSSVRQAVAKLDQGFLVGVFPEGTRTPDGTVKKFRPGFLALVRRSDLPVYPVGIAGADRALPKGAWFLRPARIQVCYGQPLSAAELDQLQAGQDDQAAAELVRQRVIELHQQAAQRLQTPRL